MNDYIKREDACRAMRQLQTDDIELYGVEIPECFDANRAINTLTSLPAADVVERKKGEWIYNPKDALEAMFTLPKCSLCGHESSDARNYCPNCGADMRNPTYTLSTESGTFSFRNTTQSNDSNPTEKGGQNDD